MLSVNNVNNKFEAIESTKTSMKLNTFTFQWVTWRKDVDCPVGVSLDFDDQNNLVPVIDMFENSLSGRKNRSIRGIPELCDQDLRPGDFVEIVNETTNHAETYQELRNALNIHMKIVDRV